MEPAQSAPGYEATLMAAFDSWGLLLDERIIATAGTNAAAWPNNDLVAVVNAPIFVRERLSRIARFDLAAFSSTAELAVKALDGAALLGSGAPLPASRQRIGIVGLADALALLGLRYDSDAGREQAGRIGRALAEGCFRGAIRSAQEHGACIEPSNGLLDAAVRRGLPAELLNAAQRRGLRHERLTAITSQPRLALFANNVADALDPLVGEASLHRIATSEQTRCVRSSGYALALRRMQSGNAAGFHPSVETTANLTASAQLAMRQAIQPWIDEPIAYPLAVVPATGASSS
jgi:ribonucleoside-diphosphate reductase alpha chain